MSFLAKTCELPDSAEFITPLFKRKKIISSQKQGEVGFIALILTCSLNIFSMLIKNSHFVLFIQKYWVGSVNEDGIVAARYIMWR